jgi:hypothetical protein
MIYNYCDKKTALYIDFDRLGIIMDIKTSSDRIEIPKNIAIEIAKVILNEYKGSGHDKS